MVLHRHIESLDELTNEEANELGPLIRRIALSLKAVVGCAKTYVIQFAEHADHPHVHFHLVPRMHDQPADRRSIHVMNYLDASQDESVSEAEMNEIGSAIRAELSREC